MEEVNRETKIEAITFQNRHSCSFTTTAGELLDEINHYRAFWLSSVEGEYSNKDPKSILLPHAVIKTKGLTQEIRDWLSKRMRG